MRARGFALWLYVWLYIGAVLALGGCSSTITPDYHREPELDAGDGALIPDAGHPSEDAGSPLPDAATPTPTPDAAAAADAGSDAGELADAGGDLDAGEHADTAPVDAGPAFEWYCSVPKLSADAYAYPMCPTNLPNNDVVMMACGNFSTGSDASVDAGILECPTSVASPCPDNEGCSVLAYVSGPGGPSYWYAGGLVHK